jgi:hypothetical protein
MLFPVLSSVLGARVLVRFVVWSWVGGWGAVREALVNWYSHSSFGDVSKTAPGKAFACLDQHTVTHCE